MDIHRDLLWFLVSLKPAEEDCYVTFKTVPKKCLTSALSDQQKLGLNICHRTITMQTFSYFKIADILLLTVLRHAKQFHCHLLFVLLLLQREDPDRESLKVLALFLHSAE